MKKLFLILGLLLIATIASGETLSWNAVTTYTDGSTITDPVSYEAVWSLSSTLSSPQPLTEVGLTAPFNITTELMPRGSTIYFGVRAIVSGHPYSAWSASLAWVVPTLAPSIPTNLRVQ